MAYKNLFSKSSKGKLVQKYSQYHINDNILHVHIPKCGGTWLKDVIYDCIAGHHRFNFSHRPASVIKQELEIEGYNYDDFNTFAVVRNPWSRLWSSYIYSRYGSEITDLDRIKGIKDEPEPKYKNPYIYVEDDAQENRESVLENIKVGFLQNDFNAKNFSDYVDKVYDLFLKGDNFENYIYLKPQYGFVVDDNKNIIVDKIFKTSEMDKVLDWVYSINKDSMIRLRAKFNPKKNTSAIQTHYYNVYDERLIKKVANLYKEDIELFNFKFED
tara:strand:- start:2368 stop:3180 length:813 start_codon:yes stop_codon:yes gene_type:complete